MSAKVLERWEGLVTTTDLCRMFGRSIVTILKWRQLLGLPCIRIPGEGHDAIRYDRAEVERWAKQHGKEIVG